MTETTIPRSFGTHSGTFHADEVTACALLLQADLIEWDKIYRSRDPMVLARCEYVCDVGGLYDPALKCFDHHQADYQGPMSSAGMILLYLKEERKIDEKLYDFLNRIVILGVDAHDNGNDLNIYGVETYSHVISNFTPIRHDCLPEEQDAAFKEALKFALGHFQRLYDRYFYVLSCRDIVESAMQKNEIVLLFNHQLPWLELFFELGGQDHPAQFVIMPSGDHWKLRGIPPSLEKKMDVRYPLPQEWAGLLDKELKEKSNIEGAIFCHKGRFISVWETREDALRALEYIMKQGKLHI